MAGRADGGDSAPSSFEAPPPGGAAGGDGFPPSGCAYGVGGLCGAPALQHPAKDLVAAVELVGEVDRVETAAVSPLQVPVAPPRAKVATVEGDWCPYAYPCKGASGTRGSGVLCHSGSVIPLPCGRGEWARLADRDNLTATSACDRAAPRRLS